MFSLKLEFERGNGDTEASETDHREGPKIDPEADIDIRRPTILPEELF